MWWSLACRFDASVTETGSQWQRCPFCGEPLSEPVGSLGWSGPTCPACGRAAAATEHPFFGVYDAVEYDFDDLSPGERAATADALIAAGVPYRWDDGYTLVVAPEREEEVDGLLDRLPPYAGDSDDVADGQEPAEWVADEESVRALAALFDAADRLRHEVDDDDAAAELADATGVVLVAPVPFGVNRVLWEIAGHLGRQVLHLLEANADSDDVVAAADALRAVLRDHV
jgi:hypothetical protein